MARMHQWIGLSMVSLSLSGCVAQEKYNALKLDRDRLAEQLGQAQSEASSARAESDLAKRQLEAMMSANGSRDGLNTNLAQHLAASQAQYEELNRRYLEAMSKIGSGTALPAALSNELTTFAAQNPDLVDFDAARGIVKFKSDVTFATGSAEVTPKAKDVISRFSTILNSPAASGYELMVAGHTDNQPVRNPATIAAGHKDNWYLSAHRAIAVGSELQSHRISANRLAVVGYADQRPAALNTGSENMAKNRRVEVLILPTQARGTVVSSGGNGATPSKAPAANLNKDTATLDNRPALNK